ncbi:MAG: HD-GYP domain-containing protein [Gemmatimonadota bacterium]
MLQRGPVRTAIITAAFAAAVLLVSLVFYYPPTLTRHYVVAFVTLVALSVAATLLHLKFTEAGSTSSMDFVPELGAILLLGPSGAVLVTLASELISESLLERTKPAYKKLFNASQLILAVGLAGLAFAEFGGSPSLVSFPIDKTFAPFVVAVLVYFAVNTGTVSYVVAASEDAAFLTTWKKLTGGLILFDLTMSSLAFALAWFYVQIENPLFVLFAIIPLIGLRYSYGTNFELQRLNTDLLRLMVKTIEAQDPYTSGHSLRVSECARAICQDLGLRGKQQRDIETAALLHDIGKIDVAYNEILRQKGPLTPEQRQLIRDHPARGVDIVRSIRSIRREVLECIRHHHERWDGNGYPDQLSGSDIPLGARIIMVCDTIDAMTTARPYRDPLPISVVREELIKHSDGQFDRKIVDVVFRSGILERIEEHSLSPINRAISPQTPTSETPASSHSREVS